MNCADREFVPLNDIWCVVLDTQTDRFEVGDAIVDVQFADLGLESLAMRRLRDADGRQVLKDEQSRKVPEESRQEWAMTELQVRCHVTLLRAHGSFGLSLHSTQREIATECFWASPRGSCVRWSACRIRPVRTAGSTPQSAGPPTRRAIPPRPANSNANSANVTLGPLISSLTGDTIFFSIFIQTNYLRRVFTHSLWPYLGTKREHGAVIFTQRSVHSFWMQLVTLKSRGICHQRNTTITKSVCQACLPPTNTVCVPDSGVFPRVCECLYLKRNTVITPLIGFIQSSCFFLQTRSQRGVCVKLHTPARCRAQVSRARNGSVDVGRCPFKRRSVRRISSFRCLILLPRLPLQDHTTIKICSLRSRHTWCGVDTRLLSRTVPWHHLQRPLRWRHLRKDNESLQPPASGLSGVVLPPPRKLPAD